MKFFLLFTVPLSLIFLAKLSCTTHAGHFTENDVLKPLDSAFNSLHKEYTYKDFVNHAGDNSDITYTFLLDLEHGYCETAGSRIHLYADNTRWAIVFEKSGYQNRASDAEIELDYFGNCYKPEIRKYGGRTYFSNSHNITLISGEEYERVRNKTGSDMETFEYISPEANDISIRGQKIPIVHDTSAYSKIGISLNEADNPKHLISYGNIVRYLSDTRPAVINATEKEIRENLPADLPKLMTIDKFHFESIYDKNNLPRKQETYRLIAKVLVKRDTALWKPALKPNNHWSNWTSGNL